MSMSARTPSSVPLKRIYIGRANSNVCL